jgi:hypothetical protein
MEPIAHGHGEARESPFVTVLRSYHEFGIHASPHPAPVYPAHSLGMGVVVGAATQSSSSAS